MTLGFAGKIARAFLDSKLTPLVIVAALGLGALALLATPREEEPQIRVPMVDVTVAWPGAEPAEAPAGPGENSTASVASSGPSTTRATWDTYTGRPCERPTTTRPTSSEVRKSGPTSTLTSRLSRTAAPAARRTEAACSAPVSWSQLTPAAAMRSTSGSTRTTRGSPPMSWARLASSTSESSWASSAASGRRRSLDQPSPHSVSARKGTSSIE